MVNVPLIGSAWKKKETNVEPVEPAYDDQLERETGFKLAAQAPAEDAIDLYDKLLTRNKDEHLFTKYVLESRSTTFYDKPIAELLRARDRHTDKIMAILHTLGDTQNLSVEAFVNEDDIMGRRAEGMEFLKWLFTRRGIAEQGDKKNNIKDFVRRD